MQHLLLLLRLLLLLLLLLLVLVLVLLLLLLVLVLLLLWAYPQLLQAARVPRRLNLPRAQPTRMPASGPDHAQHPLHNAM